VGVAGLQDVGAVVLQQDVGPVVDVPCDRAVDVLLDTPAEPVVAIGREGAAGEVDAHEPVLGVPGVARHPARAGAGQLGGPGREIAVGVVGTVEGLVLERTVGRVAGRPCNLIH